MPSLGSPVSRWVGRRLLTKAMDGGLDLSRIPVVPRSFKLPYQRHGLDPVPALDRRRDREPVTRLMRFAGMDVWLVSGHEQVRSVLADTTRFSNDIRRLVASHGRSDAHTIGGLGMTDAPDHTRLRGLLTPEFTMRRLARLRPLIADIVETRLDALEAAGPTVDLVSDFAFPVPFLVICELLGVRPEDRDRFRELGAARFDLSNGGVGLFGAASTSREFLFEVVAQQRAEPGEGLIGSIIRERGDDISDLELAGLADGVFLGGYETTASMLALGTLTLVQHPEALVMLRDDDTALDRVVEELLRYLTVVQTGFPRFARHDLDLFGRKVKSGDPVVCSLSGANRDPEIVDDPAFDPNRPTSPHLAFGYGLHRCLGAELARMELRIAYRAIARRFPGIALAVDPDDLVYRKLSLVYGVESLPVVLKP